MHPLYHVGMAASFRIGERAVWVHVNEEDGRKLQDLVEVRAVSQGRRTAVTGRPYYVVRVLRTGEVCNAWSDEMYRYDVVK